MDDDKAGAMVMLDVAIAIDNNAAPLVMVMMTGTHEAIAMMVTTTILLTTAPENVTINWTIRTNDDDNDADIGDVCENSLQPPMTATTAEMTIETMGGGGMWRDNAIISWTRSARGV